MKSEKGQSLVEFALVLPLLILLLFGIVDFARIFHVYLTMDHAGREAARAASIGKTETEIENVAYASGESIQLQTNGNVTVIFDATNPGASGTNVEIEITYPVNFITPVIGNIVGTFDLEDTTIMRVE